MTGARADPRRALHGLLASAGVLTVAPVATTATRRASVLGFAPLVGLGLGGVAAVVVVAARLLFPGTLGALLVAAVTLAALALLTRGLHLDGLADTADGLGRLGSAQESLAVMRRADIGPFGIATLVLVLVVDCAALAHDIEAGRGAVSVLAAVTCGRLAMMQSGVRGIPAAREDGLGAWVAGSVRRSTAWGLTAIAVAAATAPALIGLPGLAVRLAAAVVAGCAAAAALRRRAVRRIGGITGDVLGAVCEVATCVALVVTALR